MDILSGMALYHFLAVSSVAGTTLGGSDTLLSLRADLLDHNYDDDTHFPALLQPLFDEYQVEELTEQWLGRHPMTAGGCTACYKLMDFLFSLMKKGVSEDKLLHFTTAICVALHIEHRDVCVGFLKTSLPQITSVVTSINVTGETACRYLLVRKCGGPAIKWSVDLPDRPKPDVKPVILPDPSEVRTVKVLQLADSHVQYSYQTGAVVDCGEPLCCMKKDGTPVENGTISGFWGTGDGWCDIPVHTFDNMMFHISKQHPDIEMIYMTGDLAAHLVWKQSKISNTYSQNWTFDRLHEFFPDTPIYPALGNHDTFPLNEIPQPYVDNEYDISWLFDILDQQWRTFQPDLNSTTVRYGAYYSKVVQNGSLKVVSLNTIYCYNNNWWLWMDPNDPAEQLAWLAEELQNSEDSGQKVHIFGHIPPGSLDCMPDWSHNYNIIVNRYETTITAQFFAHTHNDQFHVFHDSDDPSRATNVAFVSPSITTYHFLNPGYRIYTVDAEKTWSVLDTETWIMNMTDASLNNRTLWYRLYSAQDDMLSEDFPSLSPQHMDTYARKLYTDETLFHQFFRYYTKDDDKRMAAGCDNNCRSEMLCFNLRSDSSDRSMCDSLDNLL